MHGVEIKKFNGYKRLQIAVQMAVGIQNNLIRRKKFKARRTIENLAKIKQMI